MIGRLITGVASLLMYLATATVLSQAVIVGGLWTSGRLNPTNLMQIRALLQGTDVTELVPHDDGPEVAVGLAEPSLIETEQARAMTALNLQKRGEEVATLYADVRRGQQDVERSQKTLAQQIEQFNQSLLDVRELATASGTAAVRATLENIEPAQAKSQIKMMLEDGRDAEVVGMFRKMSVETRATIIGEFSGDDERKIADILEQMAHGTPEVDLVDDTLGPRKVMFLNELDGNGPNADKIRRFLDDLFPKTAQTTQGTAP